MAESGVSDVSVLAPLCRIVLIFQFTDTVSSLELSSDVSPVFPALMAMLVRLILT